jgi:hypothetical protein
MGIEPTPSAWKAEVLPLNYTRSSKPRNQQCPTARFKQQTGLRLISPCQLPLNGSSKPVVEGVGFEPTKA